LDEFLCIVYSEINVIRSVIELMSQHSSRTFLVQFLVKENPRLHDLLLKVSDLLTALRP
jgi:hypothetical protein